MDQDAFASLNQLLEQDVILAAKALLGWQIGWGEMRAQIVEVEAYRTPDDRACHAHRGQTKRNRVLFGPPGFAYVYFTYGHHWMLNVSAHEPGNAAAVLIRAAKPISGLDEMRVNRNGIRSDFELLSGPGKICQAFQITGAQDGMPLIGEDRLPGGESLQFFPSGHPVKAIYETVRVGIAQGKGDELPWRFIDQKEGAWASRPRPPR